MGLTLCDTGNIHGSRTMSDELHESFERANSAIELMKIRGRITELKTKRITGQALTEPEMKELAALEDRVASDRK